MSPAATKWSLFIVLIKGKSSFRRQSEHSHRIWFTDTAPFFYHQSITSIASWSISRIQSKSAPISFLQSQQASPTLALSYLSLTQSCSNRLHSPSVFSPTTWMSQEFLFCILRFSKNVVPFVNSKENYWTYMKKKSYFKLFFGFFCYIYFHVLDLLCRREIDKCIFH